MSMSTAQVNAIFNHLKEYHSNLPNFILSVLKSRAPSHYETINDISSKIGMILDDLHAQEIQYGLRRNMSDWAYHYTAQKYAAQVVSLTKKDAGFHFGVKGTTEEKIRDFSILHLAGTMQESAPELWDLLDILLSADQDI